MIVSDPRSLRLAFGGGPNCLKIEPTLGQTVALKKNTMEVFEYECLDWGKSGTRKGL